MDNLIGLFGREELVGDLVAEIKKGKHVILTGSVGIGKSAVLREASKRAPITLLIKLDDYQAKGQFIEIARQTLVLGLVSAKELGLPVKFHNLPVADIDWKKVKNQINWMSMRDLIHTIIPALAKADTKPVIAVG